MAALCLKRKQPSSQGAIAGSASGSYGPPDGSFGHLFRPEPPRPAGGQRRRRDNRGRQVNHTSTPYYDGHLWRKYGQKNIKGALYPRLYFRCSYREDRRCMAAKLLQQLNDEYPPLFEVTYMHEHTCKAEIVPPPHVVDTQPDASGGGFVVSFGSSGAGGRHRDALVQEKRQTYNHLQPVPPSPFSKMTFGSSSNCQLVPDFHPPDVPPATASRSPMELWPSPPSMSSDEGDQLFSTFGSFNGGFDDDVVPYPESMFPLETMMGVPPSHAQLSMYGY